MRTHLIKRLILNKFFAQLFLKQILQLHNLLYKLISSYAILVNNGIHPKHTILKYKEWFYNHIEPHKVVLDIGCNDGSLPKVLSHKAAYVYGIEIVPKLVEKAKKNNDCPNVEYICADATTYDYTHLKPIDYVTLSNVLEHIENRVEFLEKIIHHVCWSSLNNQILLIRVPMINRDWVTLYKQQKGVEYRLDLTHYIEYTYEDFELELSQAKIEIISHEVKFGEIYAICKVINESI